MEARLILDLPHTGEWNMAVDETLLETAATGVATLRFYGWREPTVTLGYFQSFAAGDLDFASSGCRRIRRATGGGAIVHDQELTYSWTVPCDERWKPDHTAWYTRFHGTLLEVLTPFSPKLCLCEMPDTESAPRYLCFQRRAVGDVLVGNHKICGSAQRRHQGALLQHGSVLLARSSAAPELPGLNDLVEPVITSEWLISAWCSALQASLGITWKIENLTESESAIANQSVRKFQTVEWNRKR